ncbi:MAG: BtpA/SgcQ family protein [Planctomycetota bacterium]
MCPLLGVVHLLACPSRGSTDVDAILAAAERDARVYADGGFDGLVIENFGDAPFHKGDRQDPVPPDVVAVLALAARTVKAATGLPVAINCLRNDVHAAVGVAAATGARWVRANVFAGAAVTDQGVIEGEAARVLAYRRQLGSDVAILADLMVKHATPLAPRDPLAEAHDLAARSGAAGLIVTGDRTGAAVDPELLRRVKAAVGTFPVWIGSGLAEANAATLWPLCDGAIVGTAAKRDGRTSAPVDPDRVRRLRASCPPR